MKYCDIVTYKSLQMHGGLEGYMKLLPSTNQQETFT
jgi:hypothetical protein